MPEVIYEVMVDWEGTDWSASPDFGQAIDDISDDLALDTPVVSRGKDNGAGNAPAATLTIQLKAGLCAKYSPFNTAGTLYPYVLPWRMIRVRASQDGGSTWYPVFFGYISEITIDPWPDAASGATSLYCTDGADLLARQTVSQDTSSRTEISAGDAVSLVLDAAGWGARRNLDTGGGTVQYPAVGE